MPEFPVTGPITVAVKISAGSLEVVAEERASAEVDIQPADGRPESRELAEEIEVELRGTTLSITEPSRQGWRRRDASVALTVRVPLDSTVSTRTASAAVACHGRFATVDLEGASGDAYAEHVTGDAAIQTASGDIRTGRVDGALRVKAASGGLTAGRVGGAVSYKTASGDFEIEEAGGDVEAKTASGDVRVGSAAGGIVRITTVSGDVGIGVRAGTAVYFDVSTVSGSTRNGLDMSAGDESNGHKLTLQLRTVSGDIDIHRAN